MSTWAGIRRAIAPTERASTAILWIIALLCIAVALFGGPVLKATIAAWVVLP